MVNQLRCLVVVLGLCLVATSVSAIEKQVVAGAGPSTKVVERFFAGFAGEPAAAGIEFVVPEMSVKHAGGVANSDNFLFGRTGRPLNAAELEKNKRDIFLAKVPIVFAIGEKAGIDSLTLPQFKQIYTGEATRWSQFGGADVPIVKVGREATEALFSELKEEYPFFNQARFEMVMKKDDQVVELMKTPVGAYAIAFGAKPNFEGLKILGVGAGLDAGVRLGLVYDQKNEGNPLVEAVKAYAVSENWRQQVIADELLPVKKTN